MKCSLFDRNYLLTFRPEPTAVVAGIKVDVRQHPGGLESDELDVDFLAGRCPMQKESGDDPRPWGCSDGRLEPSRCERIAGGDRPGLVWPAPAPVYVELEVNAVPIVAKVLPTE